MPHITIIARDGSEQQIEADTNRTLMEVIRDNGIHELEAICGGCCSCATCHVYIGPEFSELLPEVSEDEDILLEGSEQRTDESRLSCQIRVTDDMEGMRLTIAPEG